MYKKIYNSPVSKSISNPNLLTYLLFPIQTLFSNINHEFPHHHPPPLSRPDLRNPNTTPPPRRLHHRILHPPQHHLQRKLHLLNPRPPRHILRHHLLQPQQLRRSLHHFLHWNLPRLPRCLLHGLGSIPMYKSSGCCGWRRSEFFVY